MGLGFQSTAPVSVRFVSTCCGLGAETYKYNPMYTTISVVFDSWYTVLQPGVYGFCPFVFALEAWCPCFFWVLAGIKRGIDTSSWVRASPSLKFLLAVCLSADIFWLNVAAHLPFSVL
jgi:hypothetical protein